MSTILIVDDDAEVRSALAILLAGLGVISEASNGSDALLRVAAEKPRLMLLDIAMPGLGGLAVLEAALKLVPSLVVLMLTGEHEIDTAKGALDIGARAYITKPFDGPALRGDVERIMAVNADGQYPAPYKPWRVAL